MIIYRSRAHKFKKPASAAYILTLFLHCLGNFRHLKIIAIARPFLRWPVRPKWAEERGGDWGIIVQFALLKCRLETFKITKRVSCKEVEVQSGFGGGGRGFKRVDGG